MNHLAHHPTNKHRPKQDFYDSWPDESRGACMYYLHGVVIDHEFETACSYEYARESKVLRNAAALRKELIQQLDWGEIIDGDKKIPFPPNLDDEVVHKICAATPEAVWIIQGWWPATWQCSSFPQLPWNQLGEGEREIIARYFPTTKTQPLHMKEVSLLDSLGIFREFKHMAALARERRQQSIRNKQASPKIFPVIDKGQWVEALFTINFSKRKKQLLKEFEVWLDLPENKERLAKYKQDPRGKTGIYKDRLKDLATWRLHEHLPENGLSKFDQLIKFTDKNRKYDAAGQRLPFHDERQDPSSKMRLNQASLYSDQPQCLNAIQRARDYLGEIIPWEFGIFSEQPQSKFLKELEKYSQ